MNINKRIFFFISIICLLAAADQASKTILISYLKTQPNRSVNLAPILDLVYAWNYGISFGLLQNYYQYSNLSFLILNSIIICYLGYQAIKPSSHLFFLGLTTIIGGALGNLIDRIFRGAVFDFIYFNYYEYDFPAFNLADSFITIGAFLIMSEYVFYKNKKILDDKNN